MRILIVLLCLILPLQVDATVDQLMQKVQERYQTLDSFKANFTQTYLSKRFSDSLVEKGVVYFRKGGFMKWEYQQPEPKVFISDGFFYSYYIPQDKQMVKVPADQSSDQHSPTLFLAGRGNFLTDFRATLADPRPGTHLIKLVPVKPQSDFSYLIVDVDPVTGIILRLLVVDAYENRTEYSFQQIEENPQLPDNFFTFVPPPGTDVVFQRGETE